jgi:hypothetical protein
VKAGKSDRRYPLPESVMGGPRRTPQAPLAPGTE